MAAAATRKLALLVLLIGVVQANMFPRWNMMESFVSKSNRKIIRACTTKPTLVAISASEKVFRSHYEASYGEEITMICSAEKEANVTITGPNAISKQINSSSALVTVRPRAGEYSYSCRDSITGCSDWLTLVVVHRLEVSVKSPRVHRATRGDRYFIPQGDTYDIYCSGIEIDSFKIYYIHNEITSHEHDVLLTEILNATTLKHTAHADEMVEEKHYCCKNENYNLYNGKAIWVTVDYYPEGQNLSCIAYEWIQFECTWISSTARNAFKLYYQDDKDTALLCVDGQGGSTRACKWNIASYKFLYSKSYLSLQLESCNEIFCDKQSFNFYRWSIIKLYAPTDLEVLDTSSHRATIGWRTETGSVHGQHIFKVEYRLLTTGWQPANVTKVQCGNGLFNCEIQLHLPCPSTHYEVRIYVKITQAEDRLWSEPGSVYFITKTLNNDDMKEDPKCNAKFIPQQERPSVESVLNELRLLISDNLEDMSIMRKQTANRKRKLANIMALKVARNV